MEEKSISTKIFFKRLEIQSSGKLGMAKRPEKERNIEILIRSRPK